MSLDESYQDERLDSEKRKHLLDIARAHALQKKLAAKSRASLLNSRLGAAMRDGDTLAADKLRAEVATARAEQRAHRDEYDALKFWYSAIHADRIARRREARELAAKSKLEMEEKRIALIAGQSAMDATSLASHRRATFKATAGAASVPAIDAKAARKVFSHIDAIEAQLKDRVIPIDPTIDADAVAKKMKKMRAMFASKKRASSDSPNTGTDNHNTDNRNNEKAQE